MMDETTPMSRQIQVAQDIARLQTTVEDMGRRLDQGFDRLSSELDRIGATVTHHDYVIQRFEEKEVKRSATKAGALKWLAGIAASVIVGMILLLLRRS